eukprot:TRINITY_DN1907_c0_g1_i4.p1 TRINITY_DN1907_c0_g1~~TRINITY_DN1907_c0_g1_i4.p1  ORF type:complete len:209 (+),score=68.40 TRINITY_DN1907_c0_g1_i4:216-842(+)
MHWISNNGILFIIRNFFSIFGDFLDFFGLFLIIFLSLFIRCNNGHYEITKLLLERGTDTQVKDIVYFQTPLGFAKYRQFESIVSLMDPDYKMEKRQEKNLKENGNKPVLTKQSPLFLLRYQLDEAEIEKLKEFRREGEGSDVELNGIDTLLKEYNGGRVSFHFSHSFDRHCKQIEDNRMKVKEEKKVNHLLRSSTLSSNEHMNVYLLE